MVIAMCAILAAILLPALSWAKRKAQRTKCLDNLNELQLCWMIYPDENKNVCPPIGLGLDL